MNIPFPANRISSMAKAQVVENGRVISESKWHPNLWLDLGITNMVSLNLTLAQMFETAHAGTGTTPTVDDSGAITATAASGTVTASAPFFAAGDVGKIINFDDFTAAYITHYTSTTQVETGLAINVGSATAFSLWRVGQTALAAEVGRSTGYLSGTGNCDWSAVSNQRTLVRTFEFAIETSPQNYAELAFGPNTTGYPIASRVFLSGGAVTVLAGQSLRVVYEVIETQEPHTDQVGSWPITGWPVAPATGTSGKWNIQRVEYSTVNTDGSSGTTTGGARNEISKAQTCVMGISAASTAPAAYGSSNGIAADLSFVSSLTPGALTPVGDGSYYRDFSATFTPSSFASTVIRSVKLGDGFGSAGAGNVGFVFVFDEEQTKDLVHSLTLSIRHTFGRVLTNP